MIDYYLPDNRDRVDPHYDFTLERSSADRQVRDDIYCHEILARPYDGMLLSFAAVEHGAYSAAARRRLYRSGVREFFRAPRWLKFLGDCGAFSYAQAHEPTYSVRQVVDFYSTIGVDAGISVDHIVFGLSAAPVEPTPDQHRRYEITLDLAREFLSESKGRGFEPIGAVQGWDFASCQESVRRLQAMGYSRLAVGGVVKLKSTHLNALLGAIDEVRLSSTRLHLLGIARAEEAPNFASFGVTSIDSTSPLRRAWTDSRHNYWIGSESYAALRVPSSDSPKVSKRISSGEIDFEVLRKMETAALTSLKAYAKGSGSLEQALEHLLTYQALHSPKPAQATKKRTDDYTRTLQDKPWEKCACPICEQLGYEVVLFRGAERNRRRGFHNVGQFAGELRRALDRPDAVLISCGLNKVRPGARARDLYTGSLFRAHLKIADTYQAPVYVMSAKYGLLEPNEYVEHYDLSLTKLGKPGRQAWAQRIKAELARKVPRAQKVVVLGGVHYTSWTSELDMEVLDPLAGKTLGERLQYAKRAG